MEAVATVDVSADRDSWCTPSWLTDLLPEADLDPCSNSRSTVRVRKTYSLERGEDGLALPWFGMVYVNPPYSDVLPWAEKLALAYRGGWDAMKWPTMTGASSAGFLVNADPSTQWWKTLRGVLPLRLDFNKRIQFVPPPGVKPSSNSKPQALLCDEAFLNACDPKLLEMGCLWRRV